MNTADQIAPTPRDISHVVSVTPRMNVGRERMIKQTYSAQWVPAHPGAPVSSHSCTAEAFVAADNYQRAEPTGSRQLTCSSGFSLRHPAPTTADQNSIPLPPQRFVPDSNTAAAQVTAGNQRERLSEHWTRHFDHSLRLDDKLNSPGVRDSRASRDAYITRQRLCAAAESADRQESFRSSHGLEATNSQGAESTFQVKQSYVPGTVHQRLVGLIGSGELSSEQLEETLNASLNPQPYRALTPLIAQHESAPSSPELYWTAAHVQPTIRATMSTLRAEPELEPSNVCMEPEPESLAGSNNRVDGVLRELRSKLLDLSSAR